MRPLAGVLTMLLLIGCNSSNSESTAKTDAERDGDSITRPPLADSAAWLTNGKLGVRLDKFSAAELDQTHPTFEAGSLFFSDRYAGTAEEKIVPHGNPFRPVVDWGSNSLNQGIPNVQQHMDFKAGLLISEWIYNGAKCRAETFIDPDVSQIAQSISIDPAPAGEYLIWVENKSHGIADDELYASLLKTRGLIAPWNVFMESSLDVKGLTDTPIRPREFSIDRPTRIETQFTGAFENLPKSTFAELKARHTKFMEDFWRTDIEIEGPEDDQIAIDSFLYYLRNAIPKNAETPVGPMGLSSSQYNGHVFWDADIWIFPALALIDPERAKTISNYRIAKAAAAERNFKERRSWFRNAPTAEEVASVDALQYPWESSVSGLEVSPTETKQQHHITGDVVWGLDLAAALGLADPAKVEAIGKKATKFYQFRASKVEIEKTEGSNYDFRSFRSILDTVSPDENYFGDSDLYTNAIAEWTIKRFDPADKGLSFFLPRDGATFLNYGGDRLRTYKQAAGALAIYPLQNPAVEKEAKLFMDRFADKVSKNGPAMSDSVHALIWARLGEKDKAYETWRRSWIEFTNHPLMLFSEKRHKDVTYFATGAAGCLQTVLYGFLGIRIDTMAQPGAKWSIPLKGGKVLSIKPNLPDEWKSVTLKGLSILGKRYEAVFRGDEVAVSLMK